MSLCVLGVNQACGPLCDWWATGSPGELVRLSGGQGASVKKTRVLVDTPGLAGRLPIRGQAQRVEKGREWEAGPGLDHLVGISALMCPNHIWVSCVSFPQNSSAVPQALGLILPFSSTLYFTLRGILMLQSK